MVLGVGLGEPVLFLGGAHTQGAYAARAKSCNALSLAAFTICFRSPRTFTTHVDPISPPSKRHELELVQF